jgi:hypothetical protein
LLYIFTIPLERNPLYRWNVSCVIHVSGTIARISINLPEGGGIPSSTERGTDREEESDNGDSAALRPVDDVFDPFRLVRGIESLSTSAEPDQCPERPD